jgi:hypothetical protein
MKQARSLSMSTGLHRHWKSQALRLIDVRAD